MEKTLEIAGRKVTFRKSGATMLAYKRETGREFYSDLSLFLDCVKLDEKKQPVLDASGQPEIDFAKFDMDVMYSMVHVMARGADKNVPSDVLDWLDEFEDFDVIGVFCALVPMLSKEMEIDRKNV